MEINKTSESAIRIKKIAKNLFWKSGISKVTVEEICKQGGFSKMTFYRHFKNKHELARQIIATQNKESMHRYKEIMHSEKTFRLKIEGLMRFKYDIFKEIGEEFMKDVYNYKDGGLGKMFDTFREEIISKFKQDFSDAKKQGWIRKDINSDFIVFIISDLTNKILDPRLNSMYPDAQTLIEELTNFFYYGILTRDS